MSRLYASMTESSSTRLGFFAFIMLDRLNGGDYIQYPYLLKGQMRRAGGLRNHSDGKTFFQSSFISTTGQPY